MSRRSRIKRNPEKFFVPGFEKSLESIGITPEVFDEAMQGLGETLTKNSEPKEAEVEEVVEEIVEEKVEEKPTTQRKTRKATSTTTKKTTRKRSTTTKKGTTKTKKEE